MRAARAGRYLAQMTNNKDIVRRIYEESINTGRLELLDQFVSDDFEGGVAAFRANVAPLLAGFPDIRFTIQDMIAEGDRVVARWTWEATHDGPFAGLALTHKRITNSGIVIYQLRDGKVVRN